MDADLIVIGAGIVGAACAAALARRGLQVLVIDAGRPGATAAGMGHLVVMDDNPAELALSAWSLDLWRQRAPVLPGACAWSEVGTLWIAADDEEMAGAHDKLARLAAAGVPGRLLGAAALAQAEPALRRGLAGALHVPGDAIVYAPAVARAWLQGPGIRVERAEATAVDGGQVQLTDHSVRRAAAVLLANGLNARTLCPGLPLRAKKGQLLITDRYPGTVHHQLVELGYVRRAHQSDGSSVAFNLQPRPTGQLLLGSSREYDTESLDVDPAMLSRMLTRALDYVPALAGLQAIRCWAGLRAASPDGLPLLGRHPQQRGLWLATGHEGLGVTTATATGELMAALVCNEPAPIDPRPYDPARGLEAA